MSSLGSISLWPFSWPILRGPSAQQRQLAQLIMRLPRLTRGLMEADVWIERIEAYHRAIKTEPPTLGGRTFAQIQGQHRAAYVLLKGANDAVRDAVERATRAGKLREGRDYRVVKVGPEDLGALSAMTLIAVVVVSVAIVIVAAIFRPSQTFSAISQAQAFVITNLAYVNAWKAEIKAGRLGPKPPEILVHPTAPDTLPGLPDIPGLPNSSGLFLLGGGLLALYLWGKGGRR